LRQFLRAFVGMNLVLFGVLLSAMLFVVFHRRTQHVDVVPSTIWDGASDRAKEETNVHPGRLLTS
jgi:hypothetical protein